MEQDDFETVIGLEVHVQLSTASKAFCSDAVSFGGVPNANTGVVSLGHPGTLPYLNRQHLQYAVRLGLALQCQVNRYHVFDRKNYFYADLPKGYQITQDKVPVCTGGTMPIRLEGGWKEIGIHHIHMEEDAGKSIHHADELFSRIDLNRAGIPLMEIVTLPDLRSGAEVDAFMTGIRQLVRYLAISDGNMEEGSLRCDINVSVRPKGSQELFNRCEIKNVNSMKFGRQAIAFEIQRQQAIVRAGGVVAQQTLHFDADTGETSPLRSKEDAHDYRYFPEPDLPPVRLSQAMLDAERAALVPLPWEAFHHLHRDLGLPVDDAVLLSESRDTYLAFLQLVDAATEVKTLANFVVQKLIPHLHNTGNTLSGSLLPAAGIHDLLRLIREGILSVSVAYQQLFPLWLTDPTRLPSDWAAAQGLIQEKGSFSLEVLLQEIIDAYPDKWQAYRGGKKGLVGFFMGELMKRTSGRADPREAQAILAALEKK